MSESPSFFQRIKNFISQMIEFFSRPETKAQIDLILQVARVIIQVISKLNDAPSNERKREYAWMMMNFLKYCKTEDLEQMLELKRTGSLDKMESYEIDIILGNVIGTHIYEQKQKKLSSRRRARGKTR